MREATLGLFYFVKYLELTFLFVWTGLTFSSAMWFLDTIRAQEELIENDQLLIVFCIITIVLIMFNLFYNNLLINLRFYAKMQCVTCGLCLFDVINWLFCYCILAKPCRDRCVTPWTVGKWVLKAALLGTTIVLV